MSAPSGTVLVLGAGIVGLTSALALAERGYRVTILERGADVAAGASAANGGQLSYSYTDSLASPALLRELPRLALGLDRAFRLGASFDPQFLRWGLAFLRQCTAAGARAATLEALDLALESRLELHRLLERHSLEFDYARRGKLHLFFYDAAAAQAADAAATHKRARGVAQALLGPREAVAIEPALEGLAPTLHAALFAPDDESGDCERFCAGLRDLLVRAFDCEVRFDTEVLTLEIEGGRVCGARTATGLVRAETTVVCLGADAASLVAPLGVYVPVLPVRGYSLTWPATAASPAVSLTDRARRIVFCRFGERLRLAGFAEVGARAAVAAPARLQALRDAAREVLPQAADYDASPLRTWAGLRPMTPSGVPLIGRTSRPGLVLNLGHGMLGWTLACGAAARLAASFAARN